MQSEACCLQVAWTGWDSLQELLRDKLTLERCHALCQPSHTGGLFHLRVMCSHCCSSPPQSQPDTASDTPAARGTGIWIKVSM